MLVDGSCRGADCDWDHHLVRINIDRKYIKKHTHTHGARQRKYDVKILQDTEIMRIYVEEIRKGITENSEQQNNQKRKQVKISGRN